jgi:hypothetical protein
MWLSELISLIVPDRLHRKQITDEPSGEQSIRVLDIGVGASCIYPLLGFRKFGWSFIGSDIDATSLQWARDNLSRNASLGAEDNIKLVQVEPQECNLLQSQLTKSIGMLYPTAPFDYSTDTVNAVNAVKTTDTDGHNDDADEHLALEDARKAPPHAVGESRQLDMQNSAVLGLISRCIQNFKDGNCSRGVTDKLDVSADVTSIPRGPIRIALDAAAAIASSAAVSSNINTASTAAAADAAAAAADFSANITSITGGAVELSSLLETKHSSAAKCLNYIPQSFVLPVSVAAESPSLQTDETSNSQLPATVQVSNGSGYHIGHLLTACMTNPPFYDVDEEVSRAL